MYIIPRFMEEGGGGEGGETKGCGPTRRESQVNFEHLSDWFVRFAVLVTRGGSETFLLLLWLFMCLLFLC